MFHCHNLVHEDHTMMRAFNVTSTAQGRNAANAIGDTQTITNIVSNNGKTVVYDT